MGSNPLGPPPSVDVTLALFAGTKTDITPSDCPEGISPDTQDGIYLPGGWFSRPGLSGLFPQLPTLDYLLQESGEPNIFLLEDSLVDGILLEV